jgi:glycosyltransferase involved in cell wall biosynthesis
MQQSPKVSVIIPTHQGVEYIERTLSSVFSQDYDNLEVIVVDDNGKGTEAQSKTEELLKKYIKDSRFKYIIHGANKNGSAARNTGARYATGKYLNFLDDDDELGSGKIRYQINQMEGLTNEWAGSYSSTIIKLGRKKVRIVRATQSGNLLIEHLTTAIRISTASLLLRKSVWEDVGGYDETFSRHQDWEFNARILDKYKLIAAEDVYYIRNYTFRHNEVEINKKERNLVHFTDVMHTTIKSIPKDRLGNILRRKYITILIGYLKRGYIKDFIRVWNEQCFRGCDIYYLLRYIFHYLKCRAIYGKAF